MIACAMPSVAATTIGLSAFGKMCSRMMRSGRAPMLRAATTYSHCLMASTCPRTMRAVCIQLVMPMTATISTKMPASRPSEDCSGSRNSIMATSSSGSTGSARNRSVTRISGPSIR